MSKREFDGQKLLIYLTKAPKPSARLLERDTMNILALRQGSFSIYGQAN